MLTAFILSQVGEDQNKLIYSTDSIDKSELSRYLYSASGNMIEKPSFFRCFRMRRESVLAYYWKTNCTEPKSGRGGLFVIIGFVFDNALLPCYKCIIDYGRQFFGSLQTVFGFSLAEPVSDTFFWQLQNPVDDKLDWLEKQLIPVNVSSPKHFIQPLRALNRIKAFIKSGVLKRNAFPVALYCVNGSDFYAQWAVFSCEALKYVNQGYWDISSIGGTTPASFQVLCNGDCFSADFSRVAVRRYQQYLYMTVF